MEEENVLDLIFTVGILGDKLTDYRCVTAQVSR